MRFFLGCILIGVFLTFAVDCSAQEKPSLRRGGSAEIGEEKTFPKHNCLALEGEGVTIRECLHRMTYGPEGQLNRLEVPTSMIAMIGAELQWLRPLLSPIFALPVVTGLYTRDARWEDGDEARLAAQRFSGYVAGNTEVIVFGLEIEDQRVRAVEGQIDAQGSGVLRFTYADRTLAREVIFKDCRPFQEVPRPVRSYGF